MINENGTLYHNPRFVFPTMYDAWEFDRLQAHAFMALVWFSTDNRAVTLRGNDWTAEDMDEMVNLALRCRAIDIEIGGHDEQPKRNN